MLLVPPTPTAPRGALVHRVRLTLLVLLRAERGDAECEADELRLLLRRIGSIGVARIAFLWCDRVSPLIEVVERRPFVDDAIRGSFSVEGSTDALLAILVSRCGSGEVFIFSRKSTPIDLLFVTGQLTTAVS